jgi:hypothetical protein
MNASTVGKSAGFVVSNNMQEKLCVDVVVLRDLDVGSVCSVECPVQSIQSSRSATWFVLFFVRFAGVGGAMARLKRRRWVEFWLLAWGDMGVPR